MTYLTNLKKLGVKSTVLVSSVALVACGGGGSDGYYGDNNSNNNQNGNGSNVDTEKKEATGITLTVNKNELNVKGDEVSITAKAVDKDGGGVAGKTIILNIADFAKNGATSDASEKITDQAGNVTFSVKLDGTNLNLTELIFTTTIKSTKINNIRKVAVTGAGTVVQSQYELAFDDIKHLPVSGGESVVRVRAMDVNGGGVPNEKVTLAVKDFKNNGVTIKGGSSVVTDNEGYAVFTLVLPKGKEIDRQELIKAGIALETTLTEQSGASKTQISTVIVDSVKSVVSSLSILTSDNNKVNAIDGSINVVVKAKNPEGNAVANKKVKLSLDDLALEFGAKLISQTATTNANGEASFTIRTEANSANPTGQLLVTNGITIISSLDEENSAEQTSKITVVSTPEEEVAYLSAVVSDQIEIKGGQATVTITAKDKNGGSIANKQIILNVPNSQNSGLAIVNGSKVTTDNNGQASFNLAFNKTNISPDNINTLLKNGVTVSAGYTTSANTQVTQTAKVSFYQQQTIEQSKEVQRLELSATKGVVSSTNDTVQIKVRAIDVSGNFAANKSVTIGLTEAAQSNGVTLDGAATKVTDSSGYVTYTLKVNAYNAAAIENLVNSGIAIAASAMLADGSTTVKQNMQVMVEAVTLDGVDVSYLTISADQMININKGKVTITVKAVDSNGGVLIGQDVTLRVADSAKNGLTLLGGSKAKTDSNGNATFVLNYDGHINDAALLAKLKAEGVLLTATYQQASSGAIVTQTTNLRYYEQTANVDVKQININLDKGVVVAANGEVRVTVQAIDENGQVISNRKLSLALTEIAKNNGASILGASAQTPANGQAVFIVKLAAPNSEAINALVAEGLLVTASAEQSNGSAIFQTAKVMVAASVSSSADVAYLAIENFAAVDIDQNAEKTITVKAYDSKGSIVANKDIDLSLSKVYSGIRIKEGSKLTTNVNGEAKFTLVYDASITSSVDKAQLVKDGLVLSVKYGNITQTVKAAFYQQAVNIQRMDLIVDKPALVINTKSDEKIKVTAILKDSQGKAITNRQVTLALDNGALQNGVSIINTTGGSIVVTTDAAGQAPVELLVKPTTAEAVLALVSSGIGIGASVVQGDGSGVIVQNTKVNIVSAVSLAEVSYLTTDVSNTVKTTGGKSTITVKAFNSQGSKIANKLIKLNLANIPTGLNIKLDVASKTTTVNGEAQFIVTYTAPATLTEVQVNALLAGIQATATYVSDAGQNVTQSTIVQFNIDVEDAKKDALRIDLIASKGAVIADNDTFTFTAKVFDKNGNPLVGKKVGIGLNTAATENGVTVNVNSLTTNASGEAKFTILVKASDSQKIENLIANGITIAASVVQADGSRLSQNTQVMVKAPLSKDVSVLEATPSKQTVSVLGDKTVIAVKAKDSTGKGLINKEVNFALSSSLSSRVKVDRTSAITDSEGFAYFTVTVADGNIEDLLLEKGITYAVTTYNSGSTKPINQIGKINVTAPVEAINLTASTSKNELLASGDSAEVYAKLVDIKGEPIKGYPITLTVKNSALNGVTISGLEKATAMTDSSGNTKFKVDLTKITGKQYDQLLANGVDVIASITLANGVVRTTPVHFDVNEAINRNHLIILSSKTNLSVDGDKAIITVALLDQNNQPVKNENVTLSANNSASIIIGTPGSGNPTNTSEPQTVKTDSNGNAFFSVETDGTTIDDDLLIASGIELTVTYSNDAGVVKQIHRLSAFKPAPVGVQPARYSVRVQAAKPTLNVRSDITDVTVTLVDTNGGGIVNKYVELAISDFARNGAIIVGPSGLATDENGQAVFKVKVDEFTRAVGYDAANFAADDLLLTAKFKEEGYLNASQATQVNVVQAVIQNPVASIVIGVNPTEVASSTDGVYYTRNLSVSVVDFDGKPLSNQEVAMDITPTFYIKGRYTWDLVTDALGNQKEDWVIHPTVACPANPLGAAVTNSQVTNIPVKVPTFLGSAGTTAKYTTDSDGKFDFTIRYPKIYSQWLNVQIAAASTVATLPTRTVYDLGLPPLSSDYSTDGSYGPNLMSPYGTNSTCP